MSFFENLTTVQLVFFIVLAVVLVFAVITLIVAAVYGKRHRDKTPAVVKQADSAPAAQEVQSPPVPLSPRFPPTKPCISPTDTSDVAA